MTAAKIFMILINFEYVYVARITEKNKERGSEAAKKEKKKRQ